MSTATLANPFAGKATKAAGSYDVAPAGSYAAHLVAIHDLGTHDGEYKGTPKQSRKLYLVWEMSGEIKPDGNPHVIGREYTVLVEDDGSFLYATESNLRKMMEGWRGSKYQPGDPIDPMLLLGRPCLVSVSHKASGDKTYAELTSVTALPKGMTAPTRHHEPVAYHISMGTPPELDWLPWSYGQSLADIVKDSNERTGKPIGKRGKAADTPYSEAVKPTATPVAVEADDDLPF